MILIIVLIFIKKYLSLYLCNFKKFIVFEENKKDKRQRWKDYPNRLFDALESNVHDNNIKGLKDNLTLLDYNQNKFNKLLNSSIKNGSKDCAEYLISLGAVSTINTSYRKYGMNMLLDCKYYKIIEVYNIIQYLSDKYPHAFDKDAIYDKKVLIKRLIDPSKIETNQKRVDYLLENSTFFGIENIEKSIEEIYIDKPEKKLRLNSILREIKLKKLGI